MQTKSFLKILLLAVFSVVLLQGCKKKTDDLSTSKTTGIIDDAAGVKVKITHKHADGENYMNMDLFSNPYTVSSNYVLTTGVAYSLGFFEMYSTGTSALKDGDYTLTPVIGCMTCNDMYSYGYIPYRTPTTYDDYKITFTGISSTDTYTIDGTFPMNLPIGADFGSPRRHAVFINKTGNTYTITK